MSQHTREVKRDPSSSASTDAPDDTKRGAPDKMRVNVIDQDNQSLSFDITPRTPMSRLMDAYASRKGLKPASLRFMVNGQRIKDDQTAKELELEEGDTIDVMQEQLGGANDGNVRQRIRAARQQARASLDRLSACLSDVAQRNETYSEQIRGFAAESRALCDLVDTLDGAHLITTQKLEAIRNLHELQSADASPWTKDMDDIQHHQNSHDLYVRYADQERQNAARGRASNDREYADHCAQCELSYRNAAAYCQRSISALRRSVAHHEQMNRDVGHILSVVEIAQANS